MFSEENGFEYKKLLKWIIYYNVLKKPEQERHMLTECF